jgi:hypothetical protein
MLPADFYSRFGLPSARVVQLAALQELIVQQTPGRYLLGFLTSGSGTVGVCPTVPGSSNVCKVVLAINTLTLYDYDRYGSLVGMEWVIVNDGLAKPVMIIEGVAQSSITGQEGVLASGPTVTPTFTDAGRRLLSGAPGEHEPPGADHLRARLQPRIIRVRRSGD